jgi:hypothetical protein
MKVVLNHTLSIIAIAFCIQASTFAMEKPQSPPRHFLTDLIEQYQKGAALNLMQKSQKTLEDIHNLIKHMHVNLAMQRELARDVGMSGDDLMLTLDILQAEINEALQGKKPGASIVKKTPVVLKPVSKPAPAQMGPAVKPAPGQMGIERLEARLAQMGLIKAKQGDFIQVKTINQFGMGGYLGPATCPVQALRNAFILLQFARTGSDDIRAIADENDARKFIQEVEKCGQGVEWLTADEIRTITGKLGAKYQGLSNGITAVDVAQELGLDPDLIRSLQTRFHQNDYAHAFILGTMDIGQATGERGHYFALAICKEDPKYLYLIADTAPEANHLDVDGYNFKRLQYVSDLVTKGRSQIDLTQEIDKVLTKKSEEVIDRALRAMISGRTFDVRSQSTDELERMRNAITTIEQHPQNWMRKLNIDQKRTVDTARILRQQVTDELNRKKPTIKRP